MVPIMGGWRRHGHKAPSPLGSRVSRAWVGLVVLFSVLLVAQWVFALTRSPASTLLASSPALAEGVPRQPWGLAPQWIRRSERCHAGARGIMYMIGDQPTGHEAYQKRFDTQGGRKAFYAAELARAVHTARARTRLPVAVFVHLTEAVIPALNATLFGADVDCVVRGQLRIVRGQCSEQVVAPLHSPFAETLLLDADTEVCADPSAAFDAMRGHDLGLVLENDAGLALAHAQAERGPFEGEAGVRVLREFNAGAFYFRRTESAWAFFARAYRTQLEHEAAGTQRPASYTWASQRLFWTLLDEPAERARVKQLPPEFNLRQNMWARLPVLLRDRVRVVHSRLLSAPEFLSPAEQADPRTARLSAAVRAAGGACAWLNGGAAGPRARLVDLASASVTPLLPDAAPLDGSAAREDAGGGRAAGGRATASEYALPEAQQWLRSNTLRSPLPAAASSGGER